MREDIVWPFTRKVPALRIFFWCCWKMFKGVVRSGPDMETWKIHENTAYTSCYGWKNILKGFWRCFNIMWTIKALRYEWISLPRIRICLVTVWDWWTICSRRETSVVAVYSGNRGSRGFCRSVLRPCHSGLLGQGGDQRPGADFKWMVHRVEFKNAVRNIILARAIIIASLSWSWITIMITIIVSCIFIKDPYYHAQLSWQMTSRLYDHSARRTTKNLHKDCFSSFRCSNPDALSEWLRQRWTSFNASGVWFCFQQTILRLTEDIPFSLARIVLGKTPTKDVQP